MRRYTALPAVSLLALILVACSASSNANLEQARSSFSALQSQPDATKVIALETKDASDWLVKADEAYQDGEDRRDMDQLAYLTSQRIELAKQTIVLCNAETQLQNVSAQRARARLDTRTAQLDRLHSQLSVKQTSRSTMVTFSDVLFDLDKSNLKPSAMHNIQQLAEFLQRNPEHQVIIKGYTDSTGSANYNQRLSGRHADSVHMTLLSRGISPECVATHDYGRGYPVASSGTSSSRVMNRRVGVAISNDTEPVAPRSSTNG